MLHVEFCETFNDMFFKKTTLVVASVFLIGSFLHFVLK